MADKGEGIIANGGSSAVNRKGSGDNIKIYIKTFTEKTVSLEVKLSDSIGDVKVKIRAKEGIPLNQQTLVFNKMVLDDINIIRDFEIENHSTLKLMHKSRGLMRIFFKIPTRTTISFEVKPSDTIDNVKAKIWDREGIPREEQELIFNNIVLDDSGTLVDFDIKKDSTVKLMFKSRGFIKIFVKNLISETGTIIPLMVKPTDTICNVKEKIEFQEGVPREMQVLIFDNMVLDNCCTLAEFNINMESTLTLMRNTSDIHIFVRVNGRTITLFVNRSVTIDNLKAMIKEKAGIPSCLQRLIYGGRVLDDRFTLTEYYIQKEATIHLLPVLKGS